MATPLTFALALISLALLFSFSLIVSAAASTAADLLHHRSLRGGSLFDQLIIPAGYPCSEHSVQTKDGFILALQRVSFPSSDKIRLQRGPPVLLQHGLFMASDAWLLNSKEESLGYILADRGFDVWVANVRGTRWSHGHVSLSERSKAYWDWSWEELALFDLAEIFEYIYQEASSKIFLVGNSQGTIMSLAALTQPDIVKKVEAAALLSPISYLGHVNAPFVLRMVNMYLDKMIIAMGFHQLNFRSDAGIQLLDSVCDGHLNCEDLLASITVIRQGTFTRFDYGMLKNTRLYGSFRPPIFDLSLVPESLPLWMAYGGNDALADVADVQCTIKELPCKKEVLYLDSYGHVDFLLSVKAKEDVYGHMIDFFSSWGKSSSF